MKALRVATGVAAAALLLGAEGSGCEGARQVPVSVARAGSQCAVERGEPSAVLVTTPEGWRDVFRTALGAEGAAPPVDFTREALVVVGMGERPTGGYAVELQEPKAAMKDGVAAIQVTFRAPAPDAMVTQALTRPCLAIRFPREGLREVKVVDGDGKLIASARLH